jgi:hypothetical protein
MTYLFLLLDAASFSEWDGAKLKAHPVPVTSHMLWGKPVETIKQTAFADETAFKAYVDDAKNFPSGIHPHRIYSSGNCIHIIAFGDHVQ